MPGQVRFLQTHRVKCKESYVHVKVDIARYSVKILEKYTVATSKTPNPHDAGAKLP